MFKKFLFSPVIIFLLTSVGPAENDKNESKKEKIVFYNFQNRSKSKKFEYYSKIIPDSIISEIKFRDKDGKFELLKNEKVFPYTGTSALERVFDKHIQLLAQKGKEQEADFVIIGAFKVEKKKIKIKTQFFDVAFLQVIDIKEATARQQAVFVKIITKITKRIESELVESIERKYK